jgi:hypothetical protein
MGFIDPKKITRLEVPNQPGEWVDVRRCTMRDIEEVNNSLLSAGKEASNTTYRLELMSRLIVAWSDPAPVSIETLRNMDNQTFMWLDTASIMASGLREAEEKKASNDSSSPSSQPDAESSPVSSGTSSS